MDYPIDFQVEKKLVLPDSYYERSCFPPRLDINDLDSYTFYIYPMEIALETINIKDKHKRYVIKLLITSALSKMRQAMEIAQSDED